MAIEHIQSLGEILLDPENKIQIDIQDVNGNVKVNVRQWYVGSNGDWYPTKKGFMLSLNEARELGSALMLSQRALDIRVNQR